MKLLLRQAMQFVIFVDVRVDVDYQNATGVATAPAITATVAANAIAMKAARILAAMLVATPATFATPHRHPDIHIHPTATTRITRTIHTRLTRTIRHRHLPRHLQAAPTNAGQMQAAHASP